MKNKILGIFVCMLLIATTVLPVAGNIKERTNGGFNSVKSTICNSKFLVDNGMILDQDLDGEGRGYTVLRVWGSHYEMGYAYAELLGDYIVQAINDVKEFVEEYIEHEYNDLRDFMEESVWMPPENEDEIEGIVDSLAITHPGENIDELDIKVWGSFGDWWMELGCRAHTCWGRYVEDPIKTLSTVRMDFYMPLSIFSHHVLCGHVPDDGSPLWVSLDFPGLVTTSTAVNEFGTLLRLQDTYWSYDPDLTSGRMSRMVAARYATTYATDPDVSTHLTTVYDELQNYEIMTGTFLNYYVPEGYGGVMTCNQWRSGPDFYHLRVPQEVWHHGEAMITTNEYTDGTYTPSDEDFGADAYYDDETPKTLESHWDLLADNPQPPPVINLQMLSLVYRNRSDMTIWVDGCIDRETKERIPRLGYEWSELCGPPDLDTHGELSWIDVKPGATVTGNFTVQNIGFNGSLLDWEIKDKPDWGQWTFSPDSGEDLSPEEGSVTVKVICKAPDNKNRNYKGAIKVINKEDHDDFCIIAVFLDTPKNKPFNFNFPLLNWLFDRFPNMFPILRYMLGL